MKRKLITTPLTLLLAISSFLCTQAIAEKTAAPTPAPTEKNGKKVKIPRKFPHGCRQNGFEFNNNRISLKMIPEGQAQTLYLIHNKSAQEIMLKADVQSKFVPTYEKSLPADHWTAFARDVNQITFVCFNVQGNYLNCADVLELCNYNNAKFPDSNLGTYWITLSGSQKEAIQGSIRKGILLRW